MRRRIPARHRRAAESTGRRGAHGGRSDPGLQIGARVVVDLQQLDGRAVDFDERDRDAMQIWELELAVEAIGVGMPMWSNFIGFDPDDG
jgi:hypothetical protein